MSAVTTTSATTTSATTTSAVPTNYAALHSQYYSWVVALVMKNGIERQSAEDVASDILLRFYERDFLAVYNPDHGGPGKGRFVTFLARFIDLYVRGHRDRQRKQVDRYPVVADAPIRSLPEFETLVGRESVEDWTNVDFVEMVQWLRRCVGQEVPRNKADRCDLSGMLEVLLVSVIRNDPLSITECAETFGVSLSTAYQWRDRLLAVLRDALRSGGFPCPQNVVDSA